MICTKRVSPATGECNPTYTGRDVGSSGDLAAGTNVPMQNQSPCALPLRDRGGPAGKVGGLTS